MPSLLFASDPWPAHVGSGEFFCPRCMERRAFRRTEVRRRIRILGAPLPGARLGEYVECQGCHATFRPEVLAYDAGEHTGEVIPEYQRAIKRLLALMVAADGRIREPEIGTVREIFEAVCGERLSRAQVVAEVEESRREPTTAARYLARVVGYVNDHGKEQILRAAAMVSRCDGELHEKEAALVRRLARVMAVPADRVERLLGAA